MKYCPKCNIQLDDQAVFCGNCGIKTTEQTKSVTSSSENDVKKTLIIIFAVFFIIGIIFISCVIFLVTAVISKNQSISSMSYTIQSTKSPLTTSSYTQNFVLFNNTGVEIYYLYISPSDSDDWEEDILGDSILENGDYTEITFDDYSSERYWDMRIEDADGGYEEWFDIDLFIINSIYLYIDDDGYVQAEWD